MRMTASKIRERQRQGEELLRKVNLGGALDLYRELERNGIPDKWEEKTLCDIVARALRYGDITPKQVAFAESLLKRITDRPAIEAMRAAERAAADDCPSGRMTIEGTVVSVKVKESRFGPALKMTIKTDAGWLAWGSVPKALGTVADHEANMRLEANERDDRIVQRGSRVRLVANLEPSADPKFGFFSRPTDAVIVTNGISRAVVRQLEAEIEGAMNLMERG